ncbi:MAG TPA: DNA-3-methyladenine glycosylase I [Candidatus Margulisiibacteriota bacterium]|nr:DNA-3-methyladenine glycosylase I [Candidatus Margulisiibacteriota bacterium]
MKTRCGWVSKDPLYLRYHDEEWGVPAHDERRLFEFLILEGAQAGLSWITILRKRDHYRRAFARFDPRKVADFGARDIKRLLADPGIVRNRLKIEAAIANARAFLQVQKEEGSFDHFIWSFTGGAPLQNRWRSVREVPAQTPEAQAMTRALKQRGFRFIGPTICYAFMQAVGMVNDHVASCFRYRELAGRR